jgi:hypothetical protein|tara:strand:- start:1623 stop:1793 length:171 start_codon:yes stop_codon:yes gene_type:complete
MSNFIPKKTENIISEAEKAISKNNIEDHENDKIKGEFSLKEISKATKGLFPEIWEN